jgi:uncharacterized protein (UPF0333 family)
MKQEVKKKRNDRGSLSLEHILFIGAVILVATGLTTFYSRMSSYFTNVGFAAAPTNVGGSGGTAGGTTGGTTGGTP